MKTNLSVLCVIVALTIGLFATSNTEAAPQQQSNKKLPTKLVSSTKEPQPSYEAPVELPIEKDDQLQQPGDDDNNNNNYSDENDNSSGVQSVQITPEDLIKAIAKLPANLAAQYRRQLAWMAANSKNIPVLGQLFSSIDYLFQNQDVTKDLDRPRQTAMQVGRVIEQLPGVRQLNELGNIGLHGLGNVFKRGGELANVGIDGIKAIRQPMRRLTDTLVRPLPFIGNIVGSIDEAADNTLDDVQESVKKNSRQVGAAFKRPSRNASNNGSRGLPIFG